MRSQAILKKSSRNKTTQPQQDKMHKARYPARQPGFHPNRKEIKSWKWTQTWVPGTDIKLVMSFYSMFKSYQKTKPGLRSSSVGQRLPSVHKTPRLLPRTTRETGQKNQQQQQQQHYYRQQNQTHCLLSGVMI